MRQGLCSPHCIRWHGIMLSVERQWDGESSRTLLPNLFLFMHKMTTKYSHSDSQKRKP